MTSIYEQLTKSLEYSRKSNYERLDILDQQLKENKINEGKYLRECNKLKSKKQSAQLQVELIDEDSSDNEEEESWSLWERIEFLEYQYYNNQDHYEEDELQEMKEELDELRRERGDEIEIE